MAAAPSNTDAEYDLVVIGSGGRRLHGSNTLVEGFLL